ncbi:MAG: tyrosine-type recombinase/integrase [Nannocystaceae bacterium]
MPRINNRRLTPSLCRELGTGDHPDSEIRGLYLRVTRAGSRSFTLRYRTPDGRQRRITLGSLGELTLTQARARARDLKSGVAHGEDPSAARSALRSEATVCELGEQYIAAKNLKPKTVKGYRELMKNQISPTLGKKKISSVTKGDVQGAYRRMAETAPSRAIAAVKYLRSLFAWACEEEILSDNPACKVKIPSIKNRRRYLSQDERSRFWGALKMLETNTSIHPPMLAVVKMLALTGARKSEILRLRWSEVDAEGARITKSEHKTDSRGKERVILLSPAAMEVLEAQRGLSLAWVFPSKRDAGAPIPCIDYVFQRVLKAAEITDFRIHDLRHSFASDGISRGLPLAVIGELLGHSSVRMTERYAHLSDDAARRALAEISEEMTGPSPSNVVALPAKKKTS